ncbi:MAG: polysaccharide lyase 11 [Anaerolineae bacterium]|nr:polysaccharide lyase 11 [Anaerolineae bacterium]
MIHRNSGSIELSVLAEMHLGSRVGQLRAAPVNLGPDAPRAFIVAFSADFDIDPYVEMFFFPEDTLKLAVITTEGDILWRRDLGRGVVPGVWFCPVFPFDLDGDGCDEIWFVNNPNPHHPLGMSHYCLERVDSLTGHTTGQWAWPNLAGSGQSLSHAFRNFIVGGHAQEDPILVTAQGTYGDMHLQAWDSDMNPRWHTNIPATAPGARGSHMTPITDLNNDGSQELMWGERCIRLDTGTEVFCADQDNYRGHSDIVQPLVDRATGRAFIYTCRESDSGASPRAVLFDNTGQRVWGQIEHGHIDMGWVAHIGDAGSPIAMAIRIGEKSCGPDGRFHASIDEFTFDAYCGAPHPLPYSVYRTIPVDLSGNGIHELVRGVPSGNGEVIDHRGRVLGNIHAQVALASKFCDHPGEQMLAYYPDGTIRLWADRNAEDSPLALTRYSNPLYQANQRVFANGYNWTVLGGL